MGMWWKRWGVMGERMLGGDGGKGEGRGRVEMNGIG